jgi:hypothetical protein
MPEQIENLNSDSEQSPSRFLVFITKMCEAHQWKIKELDDEHVVIQFAVNETRSQTLFIFGFDNSLEFSVPSFAAFDSLENLPHLISSTLLQVNAKTKIGFWCLEQIGDQLVYTFMHNTSMDNVTEEIFGEIVTSIIQRVEEFESLLIKMSDEADLKKDSSQ